MSGLTFQEWGQTFKLDPEQRLRQAQFLDGILKDSRFQSVLSEMEFNILAQVLRTPSADKEGLFDLRVQLLGVESLRKALAMLASDARASTIGN